VVLNRIRQLLDACGTSNRHDLVIVAIKALIEESVDTGPQIIGAMRSLGFKASHVGVILGKSEGGNPDRHRWQRGTDRMYRLHTARAVV
jgi:hypothetical protein